MIAPRNLTLGEEIYLNIDENEYLQEIYDAILHNYSVKLFGMPQSEIIPFNIDDALRFADILSKSIESPNSERHKQWAQEIIAILNALYPNTPKIEYYASSVFSSIGNYRAMDLINTEYDTGSFLDNLFASFDRDYLTIPNQTEKYFFHPQKAIYERLDEPNFSYSGPTSMGKSLLMRMFIKEKIVSGKQENYAILVPTKALVSEISSSIIQDLTTLLEKKNYKVITSTGALMLEQQHNFIFVLTPERLLYLLISNPEININYLFIDEAHKISAKDSRSAFYYKVVDMLSGRDVKPHVIFASPNIPNPEVYLSLVPNATIDKSSAISTSFSPVSQLKYLVDLVEEKIFLFNEQKRELKFIKNLGKNPKPIDNIRNIIANSPKKQSIVYFSAKETAIEYAVEYAKNLSPKCDHALDTLAKEIENEIHGAYYLAELVRKGVAYHVGYLPNYIRSDIEKCFKEQKIDILFCTSTLVEGVNLPADNLFVMSYKNGNTNMNAVDFRNLIGRVGRIEYNLYGTVFIIRHQQSQKTNHITELLSNDIPDQKLSLVSNLNAEDKKYIISCLSAGDVQFDNIKSKSEKPYSLIRKFGLILLRDIMRNRDSYVKNAFSEFLTPAVENNIRQEFSKNKTKPDDDINLSVDQTESLDSLIRKGAAYPSISNNVFDYNTVLNFLEKLCSVFKWEIYEKETLGYTNKDGEHSLLRWYAVILSQWMEGRGLKSIIQAAIDYKQNHYGTTVKKHNKIESYNNSRDHKNIVIAETLTIIDHVILFSIANYFLRFSTEYKKFHKVDNFDNDWYEYVEYGSTNKLTIMLQRNGFSREASEYIKQYKSKYVIETTDSPRLLPSILDCPKQSVKREVLDIQYNVPEIFK